MKYLIILIFSVIFGKSNCPHSYILIAKPEQIIGCGGILVAAQFLFINSVDSTQIIGIIICPDGYGNSFFKEDTKYNIDFSKDSLLPKKYSMMNLFDNQNKRIPVRIIDEIEPVK